MRIPGIFLLLISLCVIEAAAQGQPIGLIRSQDDNHALATDSTDWKFHRMIKEIPLQKNSSNVLLSFGGEIREQLRGYHHVNFGDVDSGISMHDLYLQHRLMLHANLGIKEFLRIFVQLNSCHATWKNSISPQVDRDDLGLMQAFADLYFNIPFPAQLRLGRQDFLFGNDRMLGPRDGPTIRQTFAGARLTIQPGKVTGDFFLVQPVSYQAGVFDNTWRRKEFVLSGYWAFPLNRNNLMDVYYFDVQFHNSTYANDTANENRHSAGVRFSKNKGSFNYDAEMTIQFGRFGNQDVRAWQLSSLIAYRWQELPCQPRMLLREALYSGDRIPGDNRINSFRPVSTKSPVHDLVAIGSSNLSLLSAEGEISLCKKLTFNLRYLVVRRYSVNDGMYQPDVRKMTRETDLPGQKKGKLILHGITAEFLYLPNKHISILTYGGIFTAGEYIRNTGRGMNMESFSVKAAYKF